MILQNFHDFYIRHYTHFNLAVFNSFEQFSHSENRMLLWHGSRLTNWAGILSQGHCLMQLFYQYTNMCVCVCIRSMISAEYLNATFIIIIFARSAYCST